VIPPLGTIVCLGLIGEPSLADAVPHGLIRSPAPRVTGYTLTVPIHLPILAARLPPLAGWSVLAAAALIAGAACRPAVPPPVAPAVSRPRSHDAVDAAVASADGVPIRYHAEGSGEPALVLIHDWCADRGDWAEQVASWSASRQVITLDLAGHGESGRDRRTWTIESLGEDVRAVVVGLDVRQAVLVGHGMGGSAALAAAGRMPERVAAVVGVDAFSDVDQRPGAAEVDRRLAGWRADFAASAKSWLDARLPRDCAPAIRERLAARLAAAPPEIALPLLRAALEYDTADAFAKVGRPIREIATTRPGDAAAGRRHAADFAVVDAVALGLGHFPMLTAPAELDRQLAAALAGAGVAQPPAALRPGGPAAP
jgi:pimeloyl-ACP methyl ester carboxylesterase